jgi:hypothetical protein
MICYNILTPDNAQETLQRLTGIPIDEWKIIRKNYNNNQVVDDYLDDILNLFLKYFDLHQCHILSLAGR